MNTTKKYDATHRSIMPGLPGTATEVSYDLPEGMSFDDWLAVCYGLADLMVCICLWKRLWLVGDLLLYGRRHFPSWMDGLVAFPPLLERKALLKVASFAAKVDPSIRRAEIPFWSYAAIGRLPKSQQEEIIGLAVDFRWSRSKINEVVKALEAMEHTAEPVVAAPTPSSLRRVLAGFRAVAGRVRRALAA